jgi:hypothetical protein
MTIIRINDSKTKRLKSASKLVRVINPRVRVTRQITPQPECRIMAAIHLNNNQAQITIQDCLSDKRILQRYEFRTIKQRD